MNIRLATVAALLLFGISTPAFAADPANIAGSVVNGEGQRLSNVWVQMYQLPFVAQDPSRLHEVRTDKHGFFTMAGLPAGTYVITANVEGQKIRCVIRHAYEGRTRHVVLRTVKNGAGENCDAPYPNGFDPDETADVYRIH